MLKLVTASTACLLVTLVVLLYAFLRRRYAYWRSRKVPGPTPSIPFGNYSELVRGKKSLSDVADDVYQQYRDERYVGTYFLGTPLLHIHDPEIIRAVFIKDFQDFNGRGMETDTDNDPLSGHLFALSGAPWRNMRVKLSPTFTSGKIKYMFSTIHETAEQLREHVVSSMERSDGEYVEDVRELLARFFTDIISSVAFGIRSNTMNNSDSEFRRMGMRPFDPSPAVAFRVLLNFFWPEIMKTFSIRSVPPDVHAFFSRIVPETIEYREKNNVDRADMLQLMIMLKNQGFIPPDAVGAESGYEHAVDRESQRQRLTLSQISAQVFVFFLAGFETTSSTTSFTLYELAKHPDVQDRVLQEVDDVLEKTSGKVTYEAVMNMHYTDMVLQETLRLWPPVPFLTRQAMVRRTLPLTDLQLDKGTRLLIPVRSLHFDPQYWDEPERYNPLRFTEEAVKARPAMVYMPFGDGPRICIGMRLALVEAKVALLTILSKCRVSLAPGTPDKLPLQPLNVLPTPIGGVKLVLKAR